MDNSIFTVEESMNQKQLNRTEEPHVEDEYKKLFEQNNNSYKQHAELWGSSDMQLREGMLSVFVRGKDAQVISFTKTNPRGFGTPSQQFVDLGSLRETISLPSK